jgi:hypothetical protein
VDTRGRPRAGDAAERAGRGARSRGSGGTPSCWRGEQVGAAAAAKGQSEPSERCQRATYNRRGGATLAALHGAATPLSRAWTSVVAGGLRPPAPPPPPARRMHGLNMCGMGGGATGGRKGACMQRRSRMGRAPAAAVHQDAGCLTHNTSRNGVRRPRRRRGPRLWRGGCAPPRPPPTSGAEDAWAPCGMGGRGGGPGQRGPGLWRGGAAPPPHPPHPHRAKPMRRCTTCSAAATQGEAPTLSTRMQAGSYTTPREQWRRGKAPANNHAGRAIQTSDTVEGGTAYKGCGGGGGKGARWRGR